MLNALRVLFWRTLAIIALSLGAVGIPLPGLPTVPFILLAAWAGARGWPSLEARLLAHPKFGPSIKAWRDGGAVPRRAKYIACLMMLSSVVVLYFSAAPALLKIALPCFLILVAAWLWRRPETLQ